MLLLRDRVAEHIGYPGSAHLGHQIVGGNFRRRHKQPFFALVGRLVAAIKEVGDVRVFLRLRRPKHRLTTIGKNLRDDARQHDGLECGGEGQRLVVACHRHEPHVGTAADVETVEAGGRERADDLAHAVGTVVETEDPVAVADAGGAFDNTRFDEFIRFTGRVGVLDCCQGIGCRHTDAFHHRIVRQFRPLPSLIPIHRVVPTDDGGHSRPLVQPSYSLQEVFHEPERRLRRRISAIEPGVNRDGQVGATGQRHYSDQMLVECMDTAGADQTHDVQRAVLATHMLHQLHEGW